jgi:hypothetical protein
MPFGAYGIRRLLDAGQRFSRNGLPVYLRVQNYISNPAVEELGFVFTPSVTGNIVNEGTSDLAINPPPTIKLMSMHSVAMAQTAGVALRAGARNVTISHTWVKARQIELGYSDPRQVFNDASVVGIVTDNLLLEIVSYIHNDSFGQIIEWIVMCNASELSASSTSGA